MGRVYKEDAIMFEGHLKQHKIELFVREKKHKGFFQEIGVS